jgi:hypothetical protein
MHTSPLSWIHAHPADMIRRSRRTYVTVAQLQSDSHSHGELIFSVKPTPALGRARHIVTCQIELRDKIKPSASANRRFLS